MTDLPELTFGHIGINVIEIEPMIKFYTDILGFKLTDRGKGGKDKKLELAFLSRNPEEHHQIVLVDVSPEDAPSTINQISFRVKDIAEVRKCYDKVVAAGIENINAVDHGTALSIYFPDPEGNRIEIYMVTPWYVKQPHQESIDFSKSNEELLQDCSVKAIANPTFMLMEQWKTNFEKAS